MWKSSRRSLEGRGWRSGQDVKIFAGIVIQSKKGSGGHFVLQLPTVVAHRGKVAKVLTISTLFLKHY